MKGDAHQVGWMTLLLTAKPLISTTGMRMRTAAIILKTSARQRCGLNVTIRINRIGGPFLCTPQVGKPRVASPGLSGLAAGALAGIGIEVTGPSARTDIRATYGGFELGVAAFLFWCAAREDWHHVGLIAATLFVAGFGVGRGVGILLEGGATAFMWSLLAIEVVYTACGLWCLRCMTEG